MAINTGRCWINAHEYILARRNRTRARATRNPIEVEACKSQRPIALQGRRAYCLPLRGAKPFPSFWCANKTALKISSTAEKKSIRQAHIKKNMSPVASNVTPYKPQSATHTTSIRANNTAVCQFRANAKRSATAAATTKTNHVIGIKSQVSLGRKGQVKALAGPYKALVKRRGAPPLYGHSN